LETRGWDTVAAEVVDVTSDPTAFGEQRLLGQLTPCPLELDNESFLASDRATDDPDEDDRHDPDADRNFHWILDQGHEYRRCRGEDAERRRGRGRPRPTRPRESEQSDIEHDGLELSGTLYHDHRYDDRDGDGGERDIASESPETPGSDLARAGARG